MDRTSAEAGPSNILCASCGLCCNGVLFDWVPVADEEVAQIGRLGFDLAKEDGETRFSQPCPMFDGCRCTVYADRPARCRAYRCELLKKAEAGEVAFPDAMRLVVEAKALVDQVRPQTESKGQAGSLGKRWAILFKEWQSRPAAARMDEAESRFLLQMTALNRFLDKHFRHENQRRIMED